MSKFRISKSHIGLLIAIVVSFLSALPANAGDGQAVKIGQFKNKEGQLVTVSYTPSPKQKLYSQRPSKMIAEDLKVRSQISAQCAAKKNPVINLAKSFVPEYTVFQMAVGLSAGQQMAEDPAWARHFYEHSLTDPTSYASFAGFMAGNHGMASLLSMLNFTHDPCRILKRNPMASAAELERTKFSQKIWGSLAGPLGMSAGLVVSSELGAALADPNIKMCAGYYLGKPRSSEQRKQAVAGCDKAYEEWVLNGGTKIRDLMPDLLSQMVVVVGMAAPKFNHAIATGRARVAAGESVESVIGGPASRLEASALKFGYSKAEGLAFRGYSFILRLGGTIGEVIPSPVLKAGLAVGNMFVFLEFSNYTSPWFKPLTQFFNGHDIGKSLTAVHNDVMAIANHGFIAPPAPQKPGYCNEKPSIRYGTHDFEDIKYLNCAGAAPESTAKKIQRLGEQEKKYRDYLLGDTMTAVGNWQDYVLNFTNSYSDAYKFYSDILRHVADGHYRKGEKNSLYDKQPLWGVPVKVEDDYTIPGELWSSRKICDLPKDVLARFDAVVNAIDKEIKRQQLPVVLLPKVSAGISMSKDGGLSPYFNLGGRKGTTNFFTDEHYDIATLKTMRDGFASMNCKSVPPSAQVTEAVREQRYNKAISTLFWSLNSLPEMPMTDARTSTQVPSIPLDSPLYPEFAEKNLYMRINMVLNGPQPLFPGAGYVKALNRDSATINQDYKDVHPTIVGTSVHGIVTPTMADYLLASMVCGPAVNQSIRERSSLDATKSMPGWIAAIPSLIRSGAAHLPGWAQNILPFYPKEIGWDIEFRPPNVINPIAPSAKHPNGINLCNDMDRSDAHVTIPRGTSVIHYAGIDDAHAAFDPYVTNFQINGKVYHGLLDVVKEFANKSIVGPDSETFNFPKWWASTVDSKALPIFARKRQQFVNDIVAKKYLPVLNDKAYATDSNFIGIKSKGLAKGLTNSIMDSVKDNLWIINMFALNGMNANEKKELVDAEKEVAVRLRVGLAMSGAPQQIRGAISFYKQRFGEVAPSDGSSPSNKEVHSALELQAFDYYAANEKATTSAINRFYAIVAKHINPQSVQIKRSVVPSLNAAFENLKGLVTEVAGLHGVVVSVKLQAGG